MQEVLNVHWPHPSLEQDWEAGLFATGCTEPWTVEVIASLVRAKRAQSVLETGGYLGTTTAWLAMALAPIGGKLTVIESDAQRKRAIERKIAELSLKNVSVLEMDAITAIEKMAPNSIDVAYLDDNHTADHVALEISTLLPKLAQHGLILIHDVYGPFGLDSVVKRFGGYTIDFPKLHVAGGLGIIQK